jgi:hypothetical protein
VSLESGLSPPVGVTVRLPVGVRARLDEVGVIAPERGRIEDTVLRIDLLSA